MKLATECLLSSSVHAALQLHCTALQGAHHISLYLENRDTLRGEIKQTS